MENFNNETITINNVEYKLDKYFDNLSAYNVRPDGKIDIIGEGETIINGASELPLKIGYVKSGITFTNFDKLEAGQLPESVSGSLTIRDSYLTKLDLKNVTINGSLIIFNCCLTNLEFNMTGIRNFICNGTFIQDAPVLDCGIFEVINNKFMLNKELLELSNSELPSQEEISGIYFDFYSDENTFKELFRVIDSGLINPARDTTFVNEKILEIRQNIYNNLESKSYDYKIETKDMKHHLERIQKAKEHEDIFDF